MIVDLHCHSTASDGSLSPAELVARALAQNVELLAITDHDTLAGYLAVKDDCPLPLLPGIELSSVWGKAAIHVVGLGVDPDSPQLQAAIARQQRARELRAEMIAEKLEKRGFNGALAAAKGYAGDSQIGRPHFARFLVEAGHVSSTAKAFKRYLGAGKVGDIKAVWPAMSEVVGWIRDSGGVAVLAHPLHYKMTATKLSALLTDFVDAGGEAMELVSGQQSADNTRHLQRLLEQFGLEASAGSDFHHPGTGWSELGRMAAMPYKLAETTPPVWQRWRQLYSLD